MENSCNPINSESTKVFKVAYSDLGEWHGFVYGMDVDGTGAVTAYVRRAIEVQGGGRVIESKTARGSQPVPFLTTVEALRWAKHKTNVSVQKCRDKALIQKAIMPLRYHGVIKLLGEAIKTTKNEALDCVITTTMTMKVSKHISTDSLYNGLLGHLGIGEHCNHEFDCCGCPFNWGLAVKRTKRGELFVTYRTSRNY